MRYTYRFIDSWEYMSRTRPISMRQQRGFGIARVNDTPSTVRGSENIAQYFADQRTRRNNEVDRRIGLL